MHSGRWSRRSGTGAFESHSAADGHGNLNGGDQVRDRSRRFCEPARNNRKKSTRPRLPEALKQGGRRLAIAVPSPAVVVGRSLTSPEGETVHFSHCPKRCSISSSGILARIERTMESSAARRSQLFLNLRLWVVEYRCINLLQSLDTARPGLFRPRPREPPKNQRNEGRKFPAPLATVANHEPSPRKSNNLFDRFLNQSAAEPR